jgi:hypothetical protein
MSDYRYMIILVDTNATNLIDRVKPITSNNKKCQKLKYLSVLRMERLVNLVKIKKNS